MQDDAITQPDMTVYESDKAPPWKDILEITPNLKSSRLPNQSCDFTMNLANGEHKLDDKHDPFCLSGKRPFIKDGLEHAKTRGQLIIQVRNLMTYQPRTKCFTMLITPSWVRLVVADRSALVVTERVPLDEDGGAMLFLRFLSLLCPLTPEEKLKDEVIKAIQVGRGIDPTVRPATKEETEGFHVWLRTVQDTLPWKPTRDSPVSVISSDTGRRYLVLSHPVAYAPPQLLSRGTRVFFGKVSCSNVPVVIKDTWRYDRANLRPEKAIYEDLSRGPNPIESIPKYFEAEDVDGQETRLCTPDTREEKDKGHICTLMSYKHHRIFFETVGHPLRRWETAYELVDLIRQSILS